MNQISNTLQKLLNEIPENEMITIGDIKIIQEHSDSYIDELIKVYALGYYQGKLSK